MNWLDEILSLPAEYEDEIKKMQTGGKEIILFGAGKTAEFNLAFFADLGLNVSAFCDNSILKQGTSIRNVPVLSFESVKEKYPDAYYYITTQMFYKEIRTQLLNAGIAPSDIMKCDIIRQMTWEKGCESLYFEKKRELDWLYNRLGDDYSRKVLMSRLAFLRTRNRDYVMAVRSEHQYFENSLFDLSSIRFFADLGMYTGDTILEFEKQSSAVCDVIYGFEPEQEIMKLAKQNLSGHKNVKYIAKGTSDCDGRVNVSQSLGVMKTIESEVFFDGGAGESFEVCKLDTLLESKEIQKVDFLKMDIEGAEYQSLKGAKKLIERDKPIMAVCVYHKWDDIITIPEYVCNLKCGEDYSLFLRHYSDNQTETVCYFVPKNKVR